MTVADRDARAASAVADEIGGKAWTVDLTDTRALTDLSLECDILVNNAGFQRVAPIEEFEPENFRAMIALMLEAPFLLVRAALPSMYSNRFGRIVNVTSIHGLRASPFKSAYVAAKHGLEGFSKVTALEAGPKGVTSNCISPGYVRTPLVDQQIADQAAAHGMSEPDVMEKVLLERSAVKRLAEPREIADMALWLCGDSAGLANGASFTLDGGWSAH
ncbi:SDR family oxidoreductase [Nocardioides sambongensis]|uniref:SDR family oxidoreductase n=1 Tax=Nocardioides sambongensis TaxID=2589074 RepID=UPI001E4D5CEC|nr:SDR family oxidoreductase [Nocardioides sambongensis]